MTDKKQFNHLKHEDSAYLRQHAQNPVQWWTYGPEALQKAKDENKPILLSIGYSSCHWCHVMADESFGDELIAQKLNDNFINIKVDREELPDLDQYYQLACQVMNGRGGWPLNVFLTPDMKPYFIGTYFPKVAKEKQPSFTEVIDNLKDAYDNDLETVTKNAAQIIEAIAQPPKYEKQVEFEGHFPAPAGIMNAIKNFQDDDFGGYGAEPKFPHFTFLEWAIEHMLEGMIPEEFGKHIIKSIEQILMGGIYDHTKGGIHRYSTDKKWLVPHFEKMLYDQAGLLKLLAKASLLYPSPLVFDALIQTIDYLKSEMLSEKGYFFASQDADSEGVEGLYFTFSYEEFCDAITEFDDKLAEDLDTFIKWFGITKEGNFERQLNVISLSNEFKDQYYTPENWNKIRAVRSALLEARKGRIPPATDRKGIASWNFQMISALVDVIQYCKIESISQAATGLLNECVDGIHKAFIVPATDGGKARIKTTTTREEHVPLFEDFVMFAEAELRFYEITGNEVFKQNGLKTIEYIFKDFYKDGSFYTRSMEYSDTEEYENIHAPIFDQSFKAPIGTLFTLLRKWGTAHDFSEFLFQTEKTIDILTHISLQNPLGFGETLRALVYPKDAYRKIEVPLKWIQNNQFLKFNPNFSVRFALTFHTREDETWQICTYEGCELQGSSLAEFEQVFAPSPQSADE